MKIAIIYTSKHGTTEKVAGMIAGKLKETNEVELFSLKKNAHPDISGFGMVILGSPIYAGQASGKMKIFCQKNETVLLQKKIALFVCGMHPDQEERKKELINAYSEALHQKAVATGFLGGEFLFEQMNFFERLIINKIAKTKTSVHLIDEDGIGNFVKSMKI